MLCHDIDDETLHLVLRMQLEDLEELQQTDKGKHRADEVPDSDLAIEYYRSELAFQAQLVSDRCMCKSMAQANRRDGRVIGALVAQEKQAQRDRQMALRLSRGEAFVEDDGDAAAEAVPLLDDELLSKLAASYVFKESTQDDYYDEDETLAQPESSWWGTSRKRTGQPGTGNKRQRSCVSCLNEHAFTDVARCPCGHEYCRACLRTLFETSLTDESLFPPRCCSRPIPVEDNRHFLTPELVGGFRAKALEFSTPDRTYCHRPTCSTFVPREFIRDDVAVCPKCRSRTCTMCKGAEHKAEDCRQDTATQGLLRVAAQNGWQRCHACRRVVELDVGCNHMTCRCGAQFCYICGERWKTCDCAQWNEERLIARANVIVNRGVDAPLLEPERQAQRVEVEVQNLVANHACAHSGWRRLGVADRCEECRDYMRQFIFECTRCQVRTCQRCRFNRVH